jgi:hypothetical protein
MHLAVKFRVTFHNTLLMNKDYFQQLLPHSIIKSVKEMEGGFSGAQLYQIDLGENVLVARRSAGYCGKEGWETEMLINHHVAKYDIAPKIHFCEPNLLLSFSDYIPDLGFITLYTSAPTRAKHQLIELIRSLHNVEAQYFFKYINILEEIKKTTTHLPHQFIADDIFDILNQTMKLVWPMDRITVTHNDFHPQNILYNGNKLMLIDWEMAGLGHPFYDIACMSNYLFLDKNEGYHLLSLYLRSAAIDEDKKTFDSLRRIGYGFLASINFQCASKEKITLKKTSPITVNSHNAFSLWSEATKKNDSCINYQLGIFFTHESAKF